MIRVIEVPELLSLVDRAVEQRGAEYVYKPMPNDAEGLCRYWHESAPGCIAGTVLHLAGVPNTTLLRMDTEPLDVAISKLADAGFDLSDDALWLLTRAQECQDCGMPWGAVRDEARSNARTNRMK